MESHPRQCIIIGSVNGERGYLRDITGNRRFWIVKVHQEVQIKTWDFSDYERDQIWAEAKAIYQSGEKLYLEGELIKSAEAAQKDAMEVDERQGLVKEYLERLLPENWNDMDIYKRRDYIREPNDPTAPRGIVRRDFVSNPEIWCECFGRKPDELKPADSYQLAALMTRVSGWERTKEMKRLSLYGVQRLYRRVVTTTKCGGKWAESVVGSILANEKYVGDMCLQKSYIADHLTKHQVKNKGELPMYYVENHHEPIISRETYEAVHAEMARRAERNYHPRRNKPSELSGLIRCGKCGATYRRKISNSSTKYKKVIWACATYTYRGKHECDIKRIPEDILKAKIAEVLGLAEYDPDKVATQIAAITVPEEGVLVFALKDGIEHTATWENPSRRESWTDEMKQEARKRALKGGRKNG